VTTATESVNTSQARVAGQFPVSASLGKNLSDSWRIQKCSSAVAPFYAVLSAKVNIETA
jgi:hypothetical protein